MPAKTRSRPVRQAEPLCLLASFFATVACAKVVADRGEGDGPADARSDAPRRVKERTVSLEVPQMVSREVTEGSDGEPVLGEPEPVADAQVCVALRRDAFHAFEPFEAVDPPKCTESTAGSVVQIGGVPANSDLILTVDKPGFTPLAATYRTDDFDAAVPDWAQTTWWTVLWRVGAIDPWLEPDGRIGTGRGVVALFVAVTDTELPDAELPFGTFGGWAPMPEVDVAIEPFGEPEFHTQTRSRYRFWSMPKGSARLTFRDDRINCEPGGVTSHLMLAGMSTEALDSLEVPVLPGRIQAGVVQCYGRSESADAQAP